MIAQPLGRAPFRLPAGSQARRQWILTEAPGWLMALAAGPLLMMLTAAWPDTPDGLFHLQRVRALSEALWWGELFPRWLPDFAFGYGYPVFNFYAPAFYYLPASLHLAGMDLLMATRVSLAAGYALSGLAGYALLRRWARPWPAALGTLLFLVYPYRLYDLLVRGALPEFAAFFWLPVIGLATVHLLGAPASRRLTSLLWASLSWTGLILTHNLTALMAGMTAGGLIAMGAVLWLGRRVSARRRRAPAVPSRWWIAAVPILLGALLAAPHALPALGEASWVGLGGGASDGGYRQHLAPPDQFWRGLLLYRYPSAAEPLVAVPAVAFAALLLGAAGCLAGRGRGRRLVVAAMVVSLAAIWLCSTASTSAWRAFEPVLGRLQFPWRWQTILALSSAVGLGVGVEVLGGWISGRAGRSTSATPGDSGRRDSSLEITRGAATLKDSLRMTANAPPRRGASAGAALLKDPLRMTGWEWVRSTGGVWVVVLAAVIVWTSLGGLPVRRVASLPPDLSHEAMWEFDASHGQVGATWAGEFLPRWVSAERWAIGRAAPEGPEVAGADSSPALGADSGVAAGGDSATADGATPPSAVVTAAGFNTTRLELVATSPGRLILHTFYYPAWRAEASGQPLPTVPYGDLGLLAVEVPAGTESLEVRWAPTPAAWAGRALAFLALAALAILLAREGPILANRPAWAAWAVAVLMVVAISGVLPSRSLAAIPVGEEYGSVALRSAIILPATAATGGEPSVWLNWQVGSEPESLIASLQALDREGRLVAQDDQPIGGAFTPAKRLHAGELVSDARRIALSALPPGSYRLVVVVYRPGVPEAPLQGTSGATDGPVRTIGQVVVP